MRKPTILVQLLSISTLALTTAACSDDDAASAAAELKAQELLQVSTPVELTENGFVAPPGDFNIFSIYAAYETEACGLSDHVYGILGPSGVRIEDCPECLLPDQIDVGAPPADFDVFAKESGVQGSEDVEDIQGLRVADLAFETPVCGTYVGPRDFTVVFEHLNTTEPEVPRVFITASATFVIDADGNVLPTSEWTRCVEDADDIQCTGPDGAY